MECPFSRYNVAHARLHFIVRRLRAFGRSQLQHLRPAFMFLFNRILQRAIETIEAPRVAEHNFLFLQHDILAGLERINLP